MSEEEECAEYTGRTALIDTGCQRVQVWGDPGDSFEDVEKRMMNMADRAKKDILDIESGTDGNKKSYD